MLQKGSIVSNTERRRGVVYCRFYYKHIEVLFGHEKVQSIPQRPFSVTEKIICFGSQTFECIALHWSEFHSQAPLWLWQYGFVIPYNRGSDSTMAEFPTTMAVPFNAKLQHCASSTLFKFNTASSTLQVQHNASWTHCASWTLCARRFTIAQLATHLNACAAR